MEEQTFSDINPFNIFHGNSSKNRGDAVVTPSRPKVKFNPKDLFYDMSGEKHLIIFNHHNYLPTRYFKNVAPATRRGTDEDVKMLKSVFGDQLGFKVVSHRNKEYSDFWKILINMREEDYSSVSCLCIIILTHGTNDGILYAADRPYNFKDVIKLFENHPTLAGKPKLFFVQACRGEEMDEGTTVATDGAHDEDSTFVVPSHADFLIMRSTVEDFRSYRDYRGSWMVRELCKILENHHEDLDVLQMATLTHQRVAYDHSTNTPSDANTHDKKQVPETSFTLTKFLKF